jgi:predicted metal-dependent HD superfamily phosphohydrolase
VTGLNSGMDLLSRWPLPDALDVRDALLETYAEPSRGYHDLRHLSEVLDRLGELAAHTAYDRQAVVLAAWFHDGVYDGRPEAEERSAQWAARVLTEAGVARRTVAEVARLVRLTEDHRPRPDDLNGAVLSDADLAILASPPERYAQYVADVRREYAHVAEPLFARSRAAVLRGLVAKPTVFHTRHAIAAWENAARRNLAAELRRLEAADAAGSDPVESDPG